MCVIHHRQQSTRVVSSWKSLVGSFVFLVVFKRNVLVILRFVWVWWVVHVIFVVGVWNIHFAQVKFVVSYWFWDDRLAPIFCALSKELFVLVDLWKACVLLEGDFWHVVIGWIHIVLKKSLVGLSVLRNKARGHSWILTEPNVFCGIEGVPLWR